MKILFPLAMAAVLMTGCGQKQETKTGQQPAKSGAESSSGSPITAPVDYLGAVGKAKKSAENVADVTGVQSAINLFHNQEGRYPKDLQELVSKGYISAIPQDRYGRQLVYDPAKGQVKVTPK